MTKIQKCAICQIDNQTNLCNYCETLIKLAKENPKILAQAILYLKKNGKKINPIDTNKALTAEFLISRGNCCNNGCKNCPY